MKILDILPLTLLAFSVAIAENMVPNADSVVTNNVVCGAIANNLFSMEGIPESISVPTITIKGEGTRFEIVRDNQLLLPGETNKYYSIRLLDGACLWIKDGVNPKCNVFTVGQDYPWRSKDSQGNWKKDHKPGVIAFEGYGEIITGCNKDSGEYPLCYLFLKNGIIKFRQMSAEEGKAGDSLWGYVSDRVFFHPSYDHFDRDYNYKPCDEWGMNGYYAWPDSIKYELRRATVGDDEWNENNDSWDNKWPNQTQFWQLNNIELHCTKWWSRGIGTDQMRLESNNHLPVARISNNWDVNDVWDENVTERTVYEWQGNSKYAADNNNWSRDGWTPDYEELTAGKYYLFKTTDDNVSRAVSFDKVLDDWGDEMTVGLRDSFEIRDEFNFRKDDAGTLQFMGTWLQASNTKSTVTLTNGLELLNDMEIYTGRGLTVEGTEWDESTRTPTSLPEFSGAVTELDVRIVGGTHLPTLAKYENGALRFTGNTKGGNTGNDLWKLRLGEGLLEIGTNVTVSCYETVFAPDLKERPNREYNWLELYCASGATLETRNITACFPWWETALCKVVFTNGTLRLTGASENVVFAEVEDSGTANVTLKLGTADGVAPALTLDVTNPEATYAFNPVTRMEGDGTIRKVGPGGVMFGKDMIANLPTDGAGNLAIGFEVNEGFADFGGATEVVGVKGLGEVRNANIVVTAGRGDTGMIPLCGDGANISGVKLEMMPENSTDFITLGRFKTEDDATAFCARCTGESGLISGDNVQFDNLAFTVEPEGSIWAVKCVTTLFSSATNLEEVSRELATCADAKLSENITDVAEYTVFCEWANGMACGPAEVRSAPNAWYSYVLGQSALLVEIPTAMHVDTISFSDEAFTIEVNLEDVEIGSSARIRELAKIFGVAGSATPTGGFISESVDAQVMDVVGGKVRLRFAPKNPELSEFYIRAKANFR